MDTTSHSTSSWTIASVAMAAIIFSAAALAERAGDVPELSIRGAIDKVCGTSLPPLCGMAV